ncbi:MAG: hypothetical protein A3F14_03405 [Gammaproteobacteria bacterium RIFCSPHIGHO2_12_FULL_43_28]|nr:MAG: hypothetical protein A3F14_03405 [Gammaproteobacteria bacterium RIFCSPHIGHO2_12_FULL_43_28]
MGSFWSKHQTTPSKNAFVNSTSITGGEVSEEPTDNSGDELGRIQNKVEKMSNDFFNQAQIWEKKKLAIIAQMSNYQDKATKQDSSGVGITVSSLLKVIKSFIQTPNQELKVLEASLQPHMEDLRNKLKLACEQFSNPADTTDKQLLAILICNTSIEMLNDLQKLFSGINSEIKYCVKTEAMGETVALLLAQAAFNGLIGIPLPEINFAMSETYRLFLFNEISESTTQINDYATGIEGQMKNAEIMLDSSSKTTEQGNASLVPRKFQLFSPESTGNNLISQANTVINAPELLRRKL